MFFVFGPSGQMYRGGPEQLAQVSPVRRVQRPQALRTRAADPEATPFPPIAAPAPDPGPVNLRTQEAVSAYVQTEQGPQVQRQPLSRVQDVMTVGALTVPPDIRVNDAWQTLAEHHIAQAPVVNAQGQVVGLLLRADMAPLELLPEPGSVKDAIELARRPVSEVMVSPVPTVAADTELRRVAGVLLDTGLPGLPVTDEAGTMTGFISRTDILRAVAADPPLDLWS
ncbi:CBS domain-containing protein [Acidovorax sp. SUPP3334]|uniref:CBS domain-containing protein n=1 Tax=Acidovorax sp. SUPP3334 TaxID=2920881 RepID=UPI0023DE24D8|nr:CBS domain-containing protein [Acidovorax sp. SUPP3334]GKT25982.1 CBS domain-containing protein [Acidovorax sp. SUPP3334]